MRLQLAKQPIKLNQGVITGIFFVALFITLGIVALIIRPVIDAATDQISAFCASIPEYIPHIRQ